MSGKFITLEGIDGAGKTTQLAWITEFLRSRGIRVTATREPGGTPVGEQLRSIVLGGGHELHPETEALLMFAARREHIDKVIVPALNSGAWVVCDRFTDASFAYQGGGSGVDWDKLALLERWAQDGLQPDQTFLFDVVPEVGRERSQKAGVADRFEQEKQTFFQRVRGAYLERAANDPRRIHVIDGARSIAEIRQELTRCLEPFFIHDRV
ncbi:MAG TPA: dTMP kinase [Burkholderiales bacterium]|nr:dTMP kinase [Burkholderiales bacterium]